MVAKAYARLQLPNGTWAELTDHGDNLPDLVTMKSDHPVHQAAFDAGLVPGIHGPHLVEYDCSEVLWFLGRLRTELKTDAFRECEDKAYRWVMDHSVKEFFCATRATTARVWSRRSYTGAARQLLRPVPSGVCPGRPPRPEPGCRADALLRDAPHGLVSGCAIPHDAELGRWQRARVGQPHLAGFAIRGGLVQLAQRDGNRLHAEKARAIMDAITHAQHPITGNVGTDMALTPRFNRFAVNAGRCAWNLMTYGELIAPKARP